MVQIITIKLRQAQKLHEKTITINLRTLVVAIFCCTNQRSHVLTKLLETRVQRKDHTTISCLMPPKKEFVLCIRLSEKQIELYRKYLALVNMEDIGSRERFKSMTILHDFHHLTRVWTHPWALKLNETRLVEKEGKEAIKVKAKRDQATAAASAATAQAAAAAAAATATESTATATNNNNNNNQIDTETEELLSHMDTDNVFEMNDDDFQSHQQRTEDKRVEAAAAAAAKAIEAALAAANQRASEVLLTKTMADEVGPECENDLSLSGKLVVLGMIITLCDQKGDKLFGFFFDLYFSSHIICHCLFN